MQVSDSGGRESESRPAVGGSQIAQERSSSDNAEGNHRGRGILITGGGTAGHTNPGIAVAQSLVDLGLGRDQIHFVGGVRGSEGALVGDAGFTIDLLPGRGIVRQFDPASVLQNLRSVGSLLVGLAKGFAVVAKRRPRAVLCLGGYAAFAATAAAVVLRIPVVVSEQNARASAVNRLFGRWARVCALPFPETDLPKGVVTGNPIRPAIVAAVAEADPIGARRDLVDGATVNDGGPAITDLDDRCFVAVWAGSLGARRINDAVVELADRWAQRSDVVLYHVVGRRDWGSHGGIRPDTDGGLHYLRVPYEANMPDLLAAADLAICRAGASTVTELAVAGLPALLVPLPSAPRDHQRANTGELAEVGGAVVVDDREVNAAKLAELLDPLIADRQRRRTMADAARSVGRPEAATDVARLLLGVGCFDAKGTGTIEPVSSQQMNQPSSSVSNPVSSTGAEPENDQEMSS